MKRFAALTSLALVAFLGACSSTESTQTSANTQNSTTQQASLQNNRSSNWNNQNSWNQNTGAKRQGTQIARLDKPTQEWFMSTLPKTEHAELFGNMLGQWNTTMTWCAGPGEATETSSGTASNTATMQRFVQQEFQGEMFPGMNFQGFALFGYNASTGKYESVWCDNTSTAITNSSGTKQQDGSILWTGTFNDPSTGENRTSKATLAFNSRNSMTYTVWDRDENGKEFASLKVDYTRDQTASTQQNNTPRKASMAPTTSPNKVWPKNLRQVAGVNEHRE